MPLFWLSLAFLGGVLAGWRLGGDPSGWMTAALALAVIVLLSRWLKLFSRLRRRLPGLGGWVAGWWPPDTETSLPGFILPWLPAVFLLGAARFTSTLPALSPDHIAWYNDQETRFVVQGVIHDDPEEREAYTLFPLETERLRPLDELTYKQVQGKLLIRLPPGGDWRYGDRLRLEGWLSTPPEDEEFSYRDYLAHRGIYTTFRCGSCLTCNDRPLESCARLVQSSQGNWLRSAIYDLRRKALEVIYQIFPDPEASLLAGILLGIETGIPPEVMEAFRLTGTSHIIAISGFNFAIVAALFVAFFGRLLGRWRGMLAAWIGIAAYAVLAGASASVVRAAIMGGLAIFAVRLGGPQSGLNTLVFVAGVMALFDPHILWDVGFQLSFMATLGLLLYAEPLEQGFVRLAGRWMPEQTADRLAGPVGEFFLFTLAATLLTLPVILYHFQRLSLISLVANPLVLPAQPPLMVLGGLATLLGLIFIPLGKAAAYLAWPWNAYTIRLVELLAQARSTTVELSRLSLGAVLGFYTVLFAWTRWGGRLRDWFARLRTAHKWGEPAPRWGWALVVGMAAVCVVVWQQALAAPDGRLHLTVLDVSANGVTGDALLIQSPTGRNVLVDGGPSPNALSEALGRRLPFGRQKLDYLVVAAPGEAQVAALPRALERFGASNVLWAGLPAASYSARELQQSLAAQRVPLVQAQPGQALDLGGGARLVVLAVTRRGAVLLLEWKRFRALLPVGLDFDSLDALMKDASQGPATALLLAEGGYAPLNPPEWIERWQPWVALLSVASGNPEGLPDPETLAALEGYNLLRTDRNGWIELTTDGEKMWVEVEKSPDK